MTSDLLHEEVELYFLPWMWMCCLILGPIAALELGQTGDAV